MKLVNTVFLLGRDRYQLNATRQGLALIKVGHKRSPQVGDTRVSPTNKPQVFNQNHRWQNRESGTEDTANDDPTFESYAQNPGPKTLRGIVSRAHHKINQAKKIDVSKLKDEIARLDEIRKRSSDAYRQLKKDNPHLSREELMNSEMGRHLDAVYDEAYKERNKLSSTVQKSRRQQAAGNLITSGYHKLPPEIRSELIRVDSLVKEAHEIQRSIDEETDRSIIDILTKKLEVILASDRGVGIMQTLRNSLLSAPTVPAVKIDIDIPSWLRWQEANYRKWIDEFMLMTDGKGQKYLRRLHFSGMRADADRDGSLNVGLQATKSERKAVLFHELGHYLEYELGHEEFQAWVKERATSDPVPIPGYSQNETAYPDHFFTPYVGKYYPTVAEATEVISMGIQHFATAESMWKLYVQDREHFLITVKAIHG